MNLTPEQQAILNGEKGEVLAKVMKTLVMYGDAFGAEKLVPVTSKYGHTVISFGINTMKPVYDLYDQLLASGADFQQKFTADPLPLDPNVPSNLLQDLVFKQFMYKLQPRYEEQLRRMGIQGELHTLALRDHCFQRKASEGTGSYTWLDRIWEFLSAKGVNK